MMPKAINKSYRYLLITTYLDKLGRADGFSQQQAEELGFRIEFKTDSEWQHDNYFRCSYDGGKTWKHDQQIYNEVDEILRHRADCQPKQ